MAGDMPTEADVRSRIVAARERARIADETEPRARSARYDRETGCVEVELRNGCRFAFPAELGQGLRGAPAEQLAKVEVTPEGYGLHWEELDADLAVPALLRGVFGSRAWMREIGAGRGRAPRTRRTPAVRERPADHE